MTGIVLAGGESRRMGSDKAFLKVGGKPMIEHVMASLRKIARHIIIVTNKPECFSHYDAELTRDAWEGRGSLIGLYSGLLNSRDDCNFVAACDMPFMNPKLMEYMSGLIHDEDAVMPRIGPFVEPLHAVYRRTLLPVIADHLRRDQRRIRDIFAGQRVRYLTEDEIDRFDPTHRSFLNVNTREEYEEVICLDLECRN